MGYIVRFPWANILALFAKQRFYFRIRTRFADVAQLVEQRIRNAKVTSSIPVIGTSNKSKAVQRRP